MNSWLSVESVTPHAAEEWLQHNNNNRRYRPNHVAHLAREMRDGAFVETAEVHVFSVDGEHVICNGQHTLRAIVEYGHPVRVTVRRSTGTRAECNMVRAVGHDKGIQRSQADTFSFYDVANNTTISLGYVGRIASAIRYARRGFGTRSFNLYRTSDIYIVETVPLWYGEFADLQNAIAGCGKYTRNAILRQDVLGVALLTFYFQRDKAIDFWGAIANGSNLDDSDPRLKAYRYLASDTFDSRRVRKELPEFSTRKIAFAWNKFFDGEALSRFPTIDAKSIVKLSGTHFTGKQPVDMWPDKREIEVKP